MLLTDYAPPVQRSDLKTDVARQLRRLLKLQPRFILFHEFLQILGRPQQAHPLLIVQGHRKTAQAVNADASLFTNLKIQAATACAPALLFQLFQTGFQFFISRF